MEGAAGVAVRNFSENLLGQQVHFYVLRLKESFLLWIGTDLTFKTLAVAMNTRFGDDPTCTQLLGDATNLASSNFAKRLAKKTGCQCFVSLNIPDAALHPLIEEHVLRTFDRDPTMFSF